ncbi:protein jag [Paenibacillus selenitireducens]|uniref:RNA-binding protein KhpB n=1 Tax=Paenibacillus selenitireducens TaxID=1324314 RepID=A0A1T2XH20_9BACL|nr:RNA-binding cell elongation regulator Jag/EloR [Paenibacillus selenitireducens]OPA79006.1 protein jag [Paenibacillus selenitireducens]
MRTVVASGKSIEDAVKNGLTQLQTTEDRVSITVLEQPSKGLFGLIGAKVAKVELALLPEPEPVTISAVQASAAPVAVQEKKDDAFPLEEAVRFIKEVALTMDLDIEVEHTVEREGNVLNITGSNLGLLIGRRGQTLDALQYLTNIVVNRYSKNHLRVILDAESFRDRRRKTLEELADRLAGRVIRTRKDVVLEPMSPQERKVIHSRLQDHSKVKTFSKGEEPNRRVIITLK